MCRKHHPGTVSACRLCLLYHFCNQELSITKACVVISELTPDELQEALTIACGSYCCEVVKNVLRAGAGAHPDWMTQEFLRVAAMDNNRGSVIALFSGCRESAGAAFAIACKNRCRNIMFLLSDLCGSTQPGLPSICDHCKRSTASHLQPEITTPMR